ncbi:MAG: DUF2155 domain-containing protein [Hyphomicrobiaceae bacterium]|nr:DUF2155 domain-containing protein [Hyphomicrobiaceae bacterium]
MRFCHEFLAARFNSTSVSGVVCTVLTIAMVSPAAAGRVENKVAVFAALDKVTARISKLEVPLNQSVEFGSLKVTPRACYSSPPTEQPKTTTFVEVDERELEGAEKRVFTGWMFAESPGLNAVEHPVFDIWLTGCQQPVDNAQAAVGATEGAVGQNADAPQQQPLPRRRVRR